MSNRTIGFENIILDLRCNIINNTEVEDYIYGPVTILEKGQCESFW